MLATFERYISLVIKYSFDPVLERKIKYKLVIYINIYVCNYYEIINNIYALLKSTYSLD